jgi:hypothetical protein
MRWGYDSLEVDNVSVVAVSRRDVDCLNFGYLVPVKSVDYIHHAQCTSATPLAIHSPKVANDVDLTRPKGTVTLLKANTVDRFAEMGVSDPILVQLFDKAAAASYNVKLEEGCSPNFCLCL